MRCKVVTIRSASPNVFPKVLPTLPFIRWFNIPLIPDEENFYEDEYGYKCMNKRRRVLRLSSVDKRSFAFFPKDHFKEIFIRKPPMDVELVEFMLESEERKRAFEILFASGEFYEIDASLPFPKEMTDKIRLNPKSDYRLDIRRSVLDFPQKDWEPTYSSTKGKHVRSINIGFLNRRCYLGDGLPSQAVHPSYGRIPAQRRGKNDKLWNLFKLYKDGEK